MVKQKKLLKVKENGVRMWSSRVNSLDIQDQVGNELNGAFDQNLEKLMIKTF